MYSDDNLTSEKGYSLMYFTAPKEYATTAVYLDGKIVGAYGSVKPAQFNEFDREGIRVMEQSGTWGSWVKHLLPQMTSGGVERMVEIYLEKHLFPGITPPTAARTVARTIAEATPYMTEEAREQVNKAIAEYY